MAAYTRCRRSWESSRKGETSMGGGRAFFYIKYINCQVQIKNLTWEREHQNGALHAFGVYSL